MGVFSQILFIVLESGIVLTTLIIGGNTNGNEDTLRICVELCNTSYCDSNRICHFGSLAPPRATIKGTNNLVTLRNFVFQELRKKKSPPPTVCRPSNLPFPGCTICG